MRHHLLYLGCSGGAIPVTLHPLGVRIAEVWPDRRLYSSIGVQGAESRKVFKIAAATGFGWQRLRGRVLGPLLQSPRCSCPGPPHQAIPYWLRRDWGLFSAVRVGVPRITQASLSKLRQDSVGVRSPWVSSLILSFARASSVTTRLTRVGGACKSEPEGGRGQACQSLCHLLGTGVFRSGCRGPIPPPLVPRSPAHPASGVGVAGPGSCRLPQGAEPREGSESQSRPTGQSGAPRGRPRRRHIRRLSRGT